MNRMTAHLAMAGAARAAVPPGIDGHLADAVLSVLKNQQTHALDILDALRTSRPSSAVDAWARALRLHITQDSRSIDAPARVSLLEKREYFRARRATIPWMIAQSDLAALSVDPRADWLRIVEAFGVNVEDGEMIEHGLAWEREEYEEVFSLIHGRAIGEHAADELNARATRCIGAAGPQVLPWGAWAELAQRHLAMFMSKSDNYYRHTLGAEATADTEKQRLKGELGALAMFPVATIFWTRGVRGGEADLGLINEAIAAAVGAPERMTPAPWSFLEYGAHYEPVRRGMPTPAVWFVAPAPRAAYEAGPRMKDGGHGLPEQVAVMMKNAPYDSALAGAFLKAKYADKPPAAEVRLAYGPRLEYDVGVLRAARQFAEDDDAERLLLARRGCEVSAVECIALGHELENADRAYDTAASYERAFADPALDAIALSNASGWLVDYYRQHGRTDAALLLADRSAGTGSWQGMVTAGHLYENLGRFAEAKSLYAGVADRYEDPSQLLGFYYRAVTVRKQLELEPEWKTALARVFPNGLQPAQTDDGRPSRGVVVTKDNAKARKAGLQAGDIVVGLEGTRVDNLRQYYAVNAFSRREEMKLTVWRGKTFPVTATARNRMMGIEYRSYPIEGWRER
jgi:hypothetical protein